MIYLISHAYLVGNQVLNPGLLTTDSLVEWLITDQGEYLRKGHREEPIGKILVQSAFISTPDLTNSGTTPNVYI